MASDKAFVQDKYRELHASFLEYMAFLKEPEGAGAYQLPGHNEHILAQNS